MESTIQICRIASLKDFKNVLLGRDMAGIFKEGHVYDVKEIAGTIILTDLGEHASANWLEGNRIGAFATSGLHCLTKEEYKAEVKAE